MSFRAAARGPLSALALLAAAACADTPVAPLASPGAAPAAADVADRMHVTSRLAPAALAGTGRDVQLVLQQPATNEYRYWRVHNGSVTVFGNYGDVPAAWSLVGGGDVTNDGIDDLLWQHTDGGLVRWQITAADAIGSVAPLPSYAPTPWRVVATADFDANGNLDLVWQNTNTGYVIVWLTGSGGSLLSSVELGSAPAPWRIATAGRIRSGGSVVPTILWENPTTGARLAWLMSGNLLAHTTYDFGLVPTNWNLVALADYDDDGEPDFFWQNPTTGEILVWLMNGTTYRGTVSPGIAPLPWRLRVVRQSGGVVSGGGAPLITNVVAPVGTTVIESNARLGAATAGTARGMTFVATSTSGNSFPANYIVGTLQVVTPQGTYCATQADLVVTGTLGTALTLNGVSTTTAPQCPQLSFADLRIVPGAANVPNGVYTLTVRARDVAGNFSAVLVRTWEVDALPPSAILNPLLTTPPLSGGQTESFSGSARDNLGFVDQLALVHYSNGLGASDVVFRYNGFPLGTPLSTFFTTSANLSVTVPFFVRAVALQPTSAPNTFTNVASNAIGVADGVVLGVSDPVANWLYAPIGGFALDNTQPSPGTFFGGANQPVNASITYQASNVTTPSAGFSAGTACAAAGGNAPFTLNSASSGCATSVAITFVQNGAPNTTFQTQFTNVSLYVRTTVPGTSPFAATTAYTPASSFGGASSSTSSATGSQTTTNTYFFFPGSNGIPPFPSSAGTTTAVDAMVVASTASGYAIAFQLPTITLVNP